jgi:undecaprenyl-diphosphatase
MSSLPARGAEREGLSAASARPWWRQRWQMIIAGYCLSYLAGMAVARWLHAYGDWNDGLAWERAVMRAVDIDLPAWLDTVVLFMPWLGTNITLLPTTILVLLWLVLKEKRLHDAVYLGVVQIGSNSLNPAVKFLYDRSRPDIIPRRGWYDWAAYPSGHAIASIAVLVTLAIVLYRVKGWRWPAYLLIPLLAISLYSRVYLGVHWPTDVLGGLFMGGTWLAFTYFAFREDRRRSGRPVAAEERSPVTAAT